MYHSNVICFQCVALSFMYKSNDKQNKTKIKNIPAVRDPKIILLGCHRTLFSLISIVVIVLPLNSNLYEKLVMLHTCVTQLSTENIFK